jgi:NDP-sugar pyrophosphorylase family protein
MRAGIIAAGEGSRLRSAGILTPKPLLPVGGRSLLERPLRNLCAAGVTEVALIVSEAMAEVAEAARALSLPLAITPVIRTTASSMHSLYHLRPALHEEPFVLCTVDTVLRREELLAFVSEFWERPELDLLLAYTDFVDDEKPLYIGVSEAEGGARVTSLGQDARGSPFVTAGLYGMRPGIWPVLEQAVASGMERLRNFLGLALRGGEERDGVEASRGRGKLRVGGYRISQAIDVDRPGDVEVAERFLRQHGEL